MRPTASVIVPFAGPDGDLDRCLAALGRLALRDGDEVLVADNRPQPRPGLVAAPGPASSYFARGVAAARARGDWLVFVDADTEPAPDLLDAYLDPAPADGVGVLAGAIEDWVAEDTPVARYIAARRKLDQGTTLAHPHRPYAQTANCAVRRSAFEAAGGFPDPVRSGADADLCWRLQAAGWRLEARPAARVRHRNRTTLRALLAQLHRHGAGMQWLDRRYPGAFPPPSPRELLARFGLLARPHGALDLLALWARDLGRLHANGDPTPP
ncbi:MAG TPA: glycosyltransferase [Solirubrobacteraceae bacterium]|nr:glycosyltransferase [Solirubrobacteraceae bacterium]